MGVRVARQLHVPDRAELQESCINPIKSTAGQGRMEEALMSSHCSELSGRPRAESEWRKAAQTGATVAAEKHLLQEL